MSFNIDFDIASLLFMIVISVRFFYRRKFPLLSSKIFGGILIVGIIALVLDIAGTLSIEALPGGQVWLATFVNSLYYVTQIVLPVALVCFLIALMSSSRRIPNRIFALCCIPALIFLIVYLIALPQGGVFTISETGEYSYGPFSAITYACVGVYLVAALVILVAYRRYLSNKVRLAYLSMLCCLVVACGIQFQMPNILLTGTAVALGTSILYFTLQDPQKMVDRETDLFNVSAAREYLLAKLNSHRDFHLAALQIHDFNYNHILYGRNAAKTILKEVASCAPQKPHVWSFRVGDAMFLTSFRHLEDLDAYIRSVDALRSSPIDIGEGREISPVITTISIPHAHDLETPDSILGAVESMLLQRNLKNKAGSDIRLDSSMIVMLGKDALLEQCLRSSVNTGEGMELAYQPIYCPSKQRYVSAEVLSRYALPDGTPVPPDIFIPVVEGSGLNVPFDLQLVAHVFRDIASGAFEDTPLESVHVNLSAATFATEGVAESLVALARKFEIDPQFIVFEMTETAASSLEDNMRHTANALRQAGFHLSLDDFGSGYSNITRLMSLPFDGVKLDKDLVQKCPQLIPELMRIFNSIGIPVVAEGVETDSQRQMIVDCGIDRIQGYLYATPMPLDATVAHIK